MKKLLTICLMLLGAVAQAQNFAITATTEAAIRKNIVKGNAANYGFGMINDTLKLVGLTTRNVIFTGSTSKTDIGLGNVDNTSDLNKPVSTATQTALNLKQNQLNGTGFVKATGTTISYDNSTYLSTSSASSTYLPISNPTATGTLTAPTITNSLGATFATTSGNVGIGTTSPAYKLDVKGGNASTARFDNGGQEYTEVILANNAVAKGTLLYTNSINDLSIRNKTAGTLSFGTSDITRMTMFANGRVGIGTATDAGYLLDVNGNARFSNSSSTGGIEIGQTGFTAKLQYNSNGNLDITPRSGYNTIFTAGNVGIGTTTPSYKLDISGSGIVTQRIVSTDNQANFSLQGTLGQLNNEVGDFYINNNSASGPMIFRVGSTVERMRITSTGNVGIGTSTPNASSILDITSTTQGVLFPRLTTTQISAIASPADGLTVYNTTLKAICFYDSSAAVWKKVSHSNM